MALKRNNNPAPRVEREPPKSGGRHYPRLDLQDQCHQAPYKPTLVQVAGESIETYAEESRLPPTLIANFSALIEQTIPELIRSSKSDLIPVRVTNFLGTHLQLNTLLKEDAETCNVGQYKAALAMLEVFSKVPHVQEIAMEYTTKIWGITH